MLFRSHDNVIDIVADDHIKALIRKIQLLRITVLKYTAGSHALTCSIFLAECLAVIVHSAPIINTDYFCFLLFLHFISLFLSLFVHFASLLCSFDTKSDSCASLSCHFARSFLCFVLMIYSVWLRHSSLLISH